MHERTLAGVAAPCLALAAATSASATAPAPAAAVTVAPAVLTMPYSGAAPDLRLLRVGNPAAAPATVRLSTADVHRDAAGRTTYAAPAPGSPASWLRLSAAAVTLPPHGTAAVTVTGSVPAGIDAGDHEAAVLVEPEPPPAAAGGFQVGVAAAVRVFLVGPGPVVRRVGLAGTPRSAGVVMGGPVTATVTVENTGTVHADLTGPERPYVTLGSTRADLPEVMLARGERRDLTATFAHVPALCVCTVAAHLPEPGGAEATADVTVLVLPRDSPALLLGAVLILGTVTVLVLRRRRTARGSR